MGRLIDCPVTDLFGWVGLVEGLNWIGGGGERGIRTLDEAINPILP